MRLAMEGILYNAGVDIVLNGHCHEYERSNPVYVSCCCCHTCLACFTLCWWQCMKLYTQEFQILHVVHWIIKHYGALGMCFCTISEVQVLVPSACPVAVAT